VEHIAEFMSHVGLEDGAQTMISIEFLPPGKIMSVPRDATAFYQRGNWIDWHAMIGYGHRAELDSWVRDWAHRLTNKVVQMENDDKSIPDDQKTGGQNGYWYSGAGVDRKQLFGTNYERLRILKKKYDPDMVFHKWFPITPAD
jgi:Berberine and berberine like